LKATNKHLAHQISEILSEIQPVMIYVGRPALLSGKEGTATEKALGFVEVLRTITALPIELIDERMSTISAVRTLREAGHNAKDSKNSIDMAAAVAILDFALELEKRK
jgi:putative Holliday junction resolvase